MDASLERKPGYLFKVSSEHNGYRRSTTGTVTEGVIAQQCLLTSDQRAVDQPLRETRGRLCPWRGALVGLLFPAVVPWLSCVVRGYHF